MSYNSEKRAAQGFYDAYMKWAKAEVQRMEKERQAAWDALSDEEKAKAERIKPELISEAEFNKLETFNDERVYFIMND